MMQDVHWTLHPVFTMAKAAFSEGEALLTSKLDLHLRTKPVKRYIWNIAFFGAGTGQFGELIRNI